ncbi:MAG: hypothetical protein ACFFAE_18390, partial [Candidatus Hodarchaeota archaeon]
LFLFLFLIDLYLWLNNSTKFEKSLFGLSIFIGNTLFLLLRLIETDFSFYFYYFIPFAWKLFLTPVVGMIVCDITSRKIKKHQLTLFNSKDYL